MPPAESANIKHVLKPASFPGAKSVERGLVLGLGSIGIAEDGCLQVSDMQAPLSGIVATS